MDIYSLDQTDAWFKSPSTQRCIFGVYRRDEEKEEEVSTRMGWIDGANYRQPLLCQLPVHGAYTHVQRLNRCL